MKSAAAIAFLALLTPVVAGAQANRSQVWIERPVVSDPVTACMSRQDTLDDRKAFLDEEKYRVDREGDAIAREAARMADDLRALPPSDSGAVADYNARNDAHNRRVASHNARVADMNAAAAAQNSNSADMMAYCNFRYLR